MGNALYGEYFYMQMMLFSLNCSKRGGIAC